MKIIDCKLLSAETPTTLNHYIFTHIANGYQPTGSIVINSENVLHQAMVKYEETEPFLAGMPCPPIKMEPDKQSFLNEVITENDSLKLEVGKLIRMFQVEHNKLQECQNSFALLVEENENLKDRVRYYQDPLKTGEPNYEELAEENEILKEGIKVLIGKNARYTPIHGYEVDMGINDYSDKDHENFKENILNKIIEHNKRLNNENTN